MRRLLILCLAASVAGATSVWSPAMRGWWRLENSYLDASGCGNALAARGNVYSTVGKFGNCDSFPGANGSMLVAPACSLSGSGAFTLCGWFCLCSLNTNYGVAFQAGDTANLNNYLRSAWLGISASNGAGGSTPYTYGGGLWSANVNLSTGLTVGRNEWHFLALTYPGGSSGRLMLWLDAVKKDSITTTPALLAQKVAMGDCLSIGNYHLPVKGKCDECCYFNRALSVRDIRRVMMGMSPIE